MRLSSLSVVAALGAGVALCTPIFAPERVYAQEAPLRQDQGKEGDAVVEQPSLDPEIRTRLKELRTRRMAEYLRLQDDQVAELEGELDEFRRGQDELRRERRRLLEELRRTLGESQRPTDEARPQPRRSLTGEQEAALRQRLDALRENARARERAVIDLQERLSHKLSLEQQARLELFAERFQRQLQEGLGRVRERRQRLGTDPMRAGPRRGLRSRPPPPPR